MYHEEERRVSAWDRRHNSSPDKRWRRRRIPAMPVILRQRDPIDPRAFHGGAGGLPSTQITATDMVVIRRQWDPAS